ncbi:MAG TPA: ABC transporter permease [Xanthobacteraceae bacterium]|jgi:ABC-type nitrate/sulfonate/bicarbonate transport system permease component|nr:ABC transporter permease [Xanthobacteraceae bacterium]
MSIVTADQVSIVDEPTRAFIARTQQQHARLKIKQIVLGFGFPILLLLLWEAAARFGVIDRRFFPAPSTIIASIGPFITEDEQRANLLMNVAATLRRLALGYGIGATAGVSLGLIMGLHTATRFAVAPSIYAIFPLPKIAIYPLTIVIFGLGDPSSVALIALGVFFMTCINTLSGVRYMQPIYHDVATVFRVPAPKRWFRIFVPAAMPAIITGLRLGLGQALILVVSSEFVSSDTGIGRFIWDAWQTLDIPKMFIGLAVVLLFASVAAVGGNYLERHLIPWKR